MNITIRKRKRANGRQSLFVQVYFTKGKVKTFTVGRIYEKPSNQYQRLFNKELEKKAEEMRIKLLTENSTVNLLGNDTGYSMTSDFLPFFEQRADKLKLEKKPQTYGSFLQFKKFIGDKVISFADLKATFIEDFRSYLINEAIKKDGNRLSKTSAISYFQKYCGVIRHAHKERIIPYTDLDKISPTKEYQPKREYLTEFEIKRLYQVNTQHELLKKAFVFACYTGLRFGDVKSICKKDFTEVGEDRFELNLIMQKTEEVISIPMHKQAMEIINSIPTNSIESTVFEELKYSNQMNIELRNMAFQANIHKHIFFYTSRHSFASNLLNKGIDLLTIKELLGHQNLKTTSIYAKMSSGKKFADVMKLDSLT